MEPFYSENFAFAPITAFSPSEASREVFEIIEGFYFLNFDHKGIRDEMIRL